MVNLEMILQRPSLKGKYRIISGKNGLSHCVSWVHITEESKLLPSLISENYLILSTGVNWNSTEVLMLVLKNLIHKNAAGLCIEIGAHIQKIPPEAIKFADEHNFPIIIFPDVVRFSKITMDVNIFIYQDRNIMKYNSQRSWVTGWVAGTSTSDQILKGLASMGYFPSRSCGLTILLISISLKDEEDVYFLHYIENLFSQLNIFGIPYVDQGETFFLLLSPSYNHECHRELFEKINSASTQFMTLGLKLALGKTYPFNTPVRMAIDSANIALSSISTNSNILADYDSLNLVAVSEYLIMNGELFLNDFIRDYLGPLQKTRYYTLLNTLKTYFDCNCNKQMTAEKLFLSRQSLYARINRIKSIIGDDFDQPPQKYAVEFAVISLYHKQYRQG